MSHLSVLSPDTDTFSTPPTTPMASANNSIAPSLTRKNSGRPTSLNFEESRRQSWTPDVVLDESRSPEGPAESPASALPARLQQSNHMAPMKSPCFVHSHLDKGASLADWLRAKRDKLAHRDEETTPVLPSKQYNGPGSEPFALSRSSSMSSSLTSEEDDEYMGSLTKQLAETAVGVREMSKQLGKSPT